MQQRFSSMLSPWEACSVESCMLVSPQLLPLRECSSSGPELDCSVKLGTLTMFSRMSCCSFNITRCLRGTGVCRQLAKADVADCTAAWNSSCVQLGSRETTSFVACNSTFQGASSHVAQPWPGFMHCREHLMHYAFIQAHGGLIITLTGFVTSTQL